MRSVVLPRSFLFCVLLCALCVSVVSPSFLRAAAPREELLRLVPNSVGFCIVVQDLRSHASAWESSPFAEQLRQLPLAVKMRSSDKWKKLGCFESEMKEKIGFDWKRLRDDILGDAVAFAYRPGSPGQPQKEQGVLLLRARNEKVLADLIERVNKVQKEEGELKELTERRHHDIVYYRRLEYDRRTERDKPPTFYYVHGPILALSAQEDMLREVIDCDQSRSPNETTEATRRLRELDADRALLAVWLNPRAFDAQVDAKAAETPAERSATIKHFALYWKALESIVFALSPGERDIKMSLGVRARVAELPPSAQRLFREAATASEVWRRLPQPVLLSLGCRLDGAALLGAVGGFLTTEGQKALHAALNRPFAALLAEEDFTGDLLPALGPDWGLCLSAPARQIRLPKSEIRNAERRSQGMPQLLFALRVDTSRTKKAPQRTLLAALDFAARFVIFAHNNQSPDSPIALKTGAIDGREVRYLTSERGLPAGVQPAYGMLDGYLVLASSLDIMNRFAQAKPEAAPVAGAPVPLLRISFKDWREYLAENRETIVHFLAEHDKLSRDAAGRRMDGLLAALRFVERAHLSQRSTPGQVIFTLNVQTAFALKK